jgi:Fe-S cluster biogenesis protein NfuA
MNKTEMMERLNIALDKIRPYLHADGGDILLVDISDDMIVKVQLTGSCKSCPFSFNTLKAGVEQVIIREMPEIKKVISVNEILP